MRATLSSLKADFPDALRVFADVLRRPAFDPRKLEVERNRADLRLCRARTTSPSTSCSASSSELLYGAGLPLRPAPRPTPRLGAIRREDVAAWHRQGFHPDRTVLGLAGDFDPAEALRLVREAFGDWPRGPQTEARRRRPGASKAAPGIYFAEKHDITQSGVIMGHLGVRKDHPDYYALEVLNQVLSGASARACSPTSARARGSPTR